MRVPQARGYASASVVGVAYARQGGWAAATHLLATLRRLHACADAMVEAEAATAGKKRSECAGSKVPLSRGDTEAVAAAASVDIPAGASVRAAARPGSDGGWARHPHIPVPVAVRVPRGDEPATAPLLVALEAPRWAVASLAAARLLPAALDGVVRHRLAYGLLRTVSRAAERGVVHGRISASTVGVLPGGQLLLGGWEAAPACLVPERRVAGVVAAMAATGGGAALEGAVAKLAAAAPASHVECATCSVAASPWHAAPLTPPRGAHDGDVACAAPEVLLGLPLPLPASDAWSAACVVAAMECGGTPFAPCADLMDAYIAGRGAAEALVGPTPPHGGDLRALAARVATLASIEAALGPIDAALPAAVQLPLGATLLAELAWLREHVRASTPALTAAVTPAPAGASMEPVLRARGCPAPAAATLAAMLAISPARRASVRDALASPWMKAAPSVRGGAAAAGGDGGGGEGSDAAVLSDAAIARVEASAAPGALGAPRGGWYRPGMFPLLALAADAAEAPT